LHPEL